MVTRWKSSRSLLPFVSVGNAVFHPGFSPAPISMTQKHPQTFLLYISIKKEQILSVFIAEVCSATCALPSQTSARAKDDHILLEKIRCLEKCVFLCSTP